MKSLFLFLICTALTLANVTATAKTDSIRIFGSDLFEDWLPTLLQTDITTDNHPLEFKLTGSYGGLIALQKGYADACIFLQTSTENPVIPANFESITIAYKVLYIYSPPSFPVRSIQKQTVDAICQSGDFGSSQSWNSYLDTPENWADEAPRIIVDSGSKKITESLFRYSFASGKTPTEGVILASPEHLQEAMNESPYFLLISDDPSHSENELKTLSVVDYGDSVGFSPTPENIRYGDYAVTFPIKLLIRKDTDWSASIKTVFTSDLLQNEFQKQNLIPADA